MPIDIIVDNRENGLIAKLKEIGDRGGPGPIEGPIEGLKIETLDIGDIVFREDGKDILIIERKTVADLKASICDGRAREQKARLLHSGIAVDRIMYLIEGSLDKPLKSKTCGFPTSTLIGSLINTQLRDGIKVYKTASMSETVCFLVKLKSKLEKDGEKFFKYSSRSMSASKYAADAQKEEEG